MTGLERSPAILIHLAIESGKYNRTIGQPRDGAQQFGSCGDAASSARGNDGRRWQIVMILPRGVAQQTIATVSALNCAFSGEDERPFLAQEKKKITNVRPMLREHFRRKAPQPFKIWLLRLHLVQKSREWARHGRGASK